MFSVMVPPRPIAPGTIFPNSLAPPTSPSPSSQSTAPPVAANDVIVVGNQAFNGRGYEVCGVRNQRGRLCGRIGTCPFHSKDSALRRTHSAPTPDPAALANHSSSAQNPTVAPAPPHPNVFEPRHLRVRPEKTRFKRSWTHDEHKRFLRAMQNHGRGKWKEISREVKTRTANQCQSHAQKYFLRQAMSDEQRKKKSIHDITEDDDINHPGAVSAMQLANHAPSMSEKLEISTSQPEPITVASLPMASSAGLTSSQPCSVLPLAPRQVAESRASAEVSSSSPNDVCMPNSCAMNSSLSLGMSGDSDSLLGLRVSLPMNSSAANSPPISTSAIPSLPMPSAPANTLSVVTNSNGMSTVPFMFPMTSLGLQYASMVPSFINQSVGNPGMAAVIAPQPLPKTRVTIHLNGRAGGRKALMLPQTMEEFFQIAKSKLLIDEPLSRVFTRSGAEISDLDEMCPDDLLWLSCGEDFITPR